MKDKAKVMMAALVGVPLIMVLGNSMLIPVFPQMKSVLGISQFQVGLLITLFSIPAGLSIPFLGYLSDHTQRKNIIVPALLLYGTGGLISGLAPVLLDKPYLLLLAGRVVQGIGAAGTAPVAMALVGDIFTSQERSKALGLLESANGMGKVVSPILGSLTALLVWYAPFFVYSALSLPVALAVWFLIKEPDKKEQQRNSADYFRGLKKIFASKGIPLAAAFLAGMVILFSLFGVLSYLSDILETRYNLKGVLKGMVLAIPILTMSIVSYLSGSYLQKKQKQMKLFVTVGLSLVTAALVLAPFLWNLTVPFFLSFVLIGIGTGLVLPSLNTLVTSSAPVSERGAVTSLYGSVRFFGVAMGPPIFGKLMDVGRLPMFITGAVVAGAAALIALALINEKKLLAETPTAEQKKQKHRTWRPSPEGPVT